jgi:hypothetical protein
LAAILSWKKSRVLSLQTLGGRETETAPSGAFHLSASRMVGNLFNMDFSLSLSTLYPARRPFVNPPSTPWNPVSPFFHTMELSFPRHGSPRTGQA